MIRTPIALQKPVAQSQCGPHRSPQAPRLACKIPPICLIPYKALYYEAYALIEAIADAALDGTRKTLLTTLSTVPLLIIDDLGMRKLPHTAAEDLLENHHAALRARLDTADVKPAR